MKKYRYEWKTFHTLVVGSGAAGYCAADRLWQHGVRDIAVVTENRLWGTSRNAGSDKQTYYKLSLAGEEDSPLRLAQTLFSGGCMDGDHALCEAALSCQAFFKLTELGVPFPHDRYGEYIGYKTDHDPGRRGTSAGPYTSRYMTEVLERSAEEKGIPILDWHQVIRILSLRERVYGLLCLNKETGAYTVFACKNVIYATGGPAGLYRDSVYPPSQTGASGLAFEAGAGGKNLTEWQYGIASLKPKWNVSGSYMQVLPRMLSTDMEGQNEKEFLMEYFKSREEMLSMIFLKGYEWPFDAGKVPKGSSVIDLLVYRERWERGRRVWLDFSKNPGEKPVDFSLLPEEVENYLKRAGACQDTPYERLMQLNEPAADFYREHGVNLETDKLEIAVCAQHNNGGLLVDLWWQTGVKGLFAVGEAAGTHGICRPGGSALNSGQVGAIRAAAYIGAHTEPWQDWSEEDKEELEEQIQSRIRMGGFWTFRKAEIAEIWKEAAGRMSRDGAMVRSRAGIREDLSWVEEKISQIRSVGAEERIGNADPGDLAFFYRCYDMLLSQKVFLTAMEDYCRRVGIARGSAVYTEPASLSEVTEQDHASLVQEIFYSSETDTCAVKWRKVRPIPESDDFFETVWKEYRENSLYD
nr:FAD-binding protein [uncultured Clostridium sp.]